MSYVDLHLHTDFSMLDGLGTIPHYVKDAKNQGKSALSITDHGLLSGTHEFYMACKKVGIQPILGEEFYFATNARKAKENKEAGRFHIVILARNLKGFETLCELSTESHRNYYYKPLLDRSIIEGLGKDAKNLVVLSGCAASILSQKILNGKMESAANELEWWSECFPHFFIELQSHGTDFDRKLNKRLLKLAKRFDLPWVVTNDSHYVTHDQEPYHDALLAIQTGAELDDPDRFKFQGSGYHLRTEKEMRRAFREYGKDVYGPGIKQTGIIAKNCAIDIPQWNKASWHIPKFVGPEDSAAYLTKLCKRELKRRGLDKNKKYVKRTKHELGLINQVGIADFLLINRKIIRGAVKKGIRVGPGRGSTAGCLVGYLIGLHKMDSIRYDLLFERFLNPERPKMPDIDTDYSQSRREEVVKDIKDEYGEENVLPVAAFNTLQMKSAFQTLATAQGITFQDRMRLTKLIEEDEEGNAILPEELRDGYPDLAEQMSKLVGAKRAISSHAAGVIIFDPKDPIRKLIPEMWIPKRSGKPGRFVAQFDLVSCEGIKLMKNDVLGLRTLDTIDHCIELIESRHGKSSDYSDPDEWIPDEEPDDDLVYKMLADGYCAGVFQMEGKTNWGGIQKIKPTRFHDIVDCTSLYRAGPMDAGAPDRYLKNKRDKKIRVLHPALKEILKNSWGEMIFQEQMMKIAHEVAGLSMAKVDEIKEIVRFKDATRMGAFVEEFVQGCIDTTGMDKETAQKIWAMIEAQSTYLYNLSHATSYSFITYQTARYKRLFPLEYITALLRTVMPDSPAAKEKRLTYLSEAADHGYKILPPDINQSSALATCSGCGDWDSNENGDPGRIRFGFQDIKGIGPAASAKIVRLRDEGDAPGFYSYEEAKAILPKGIFSKLDEVGVFASIGGPEADPAVLEESIGWCFNDAMEPYRKKYADQVILPSGNDEWVQIVGEIIATEQKKTKNGNPYMTWKIRWSPANTYAVTIWESAQSKWKFKKGDIVAAEGKWQQQFGNVAIGDPAQIKRLKRVKSNAA